MRNKKEIQIQYKYKNNNNTNIDNLFDKIVHNLKLPNKENLGINLRKSIKISPAKNTFPENIMAGVFFIFLLLRISQQHDI